MYGLLIKMAAKRPGYSSGSKIDYLCDLGLMTGLLSLVTERFSHHLLLLN